MVQGTWNRYRITTKKGFTFEIIIGDWLKTGEYKFGRIEFLEKLNDQQRDDYIETEEDIMRLLGEWEGI